MLWGSRDALPGIDAARTECEVDEGTHCDVARPSVDAHHRKGRREHRRQQQVTGRPRERAQRPAEQRQRGEDGDNDGQNDAVDDAAYGHAARVQAHPVDAIQASLEVEDGAV